MTYRSTLLGCGKCVPERVMTNDEIALMVDTLDAWIYVAGPVFIAGISPRCRRRLPASRWGQREMRFCRRA